MEMIQRTKQGANQIDTYEYNTSYRDSFADSRDGLDDDDEYDTVRRNNLPNESYYENA